MERMKKRNLWFLAGLLGIGVILFWRCFYSVNTTDEAFYVGTIYRLWRGDGMLTDEWMPTQQMCSFWLVPFFSLFRLIIGSNDGMILAFRFLYIIFQLLITIYLYMRLKKYGNISVFAVFFYLLSTAFNINFLSYNTMANSCLIALLVTLAVMEDGNYKDCIWCGFFASVVVMANPYAVFAYVLFGIASVVVSAIGKKTVPAAIRFSTFLKISVTAAVIFVVFMIYVLQNSSLEDIIKNLPYIIGDQEHVYSWNDKIEGYIRIFRKHYLGVVVVPILVSVIARIDKKRVQHGWVYMGLTAASVLPYMVYHGIISDYVPVNLVTVPICFLGLTAYAVSKEKHRKIFCIWYLPAMVYPVIVQFTSNTGPLAVSSGFVTAGAASVLLTLFWAKEQGNRLLQKLFYVIVIFQLAMMLFLRITYVWADAPISELNTKVERGAAKGLYTTVGAAQFYEDMYDDIDAIGIKEDEGFLVIGAEPLLYLYADTKVASYSTWQVFTNETRLYRYYEVHEGEGQFPTVVYCAEADETIFESIFVDKLLLPQGYEWKQMKKGIAFYTPR